jgi:hypothetical protein
MDIIEEAIKKDLGCAIGVYGASHRFASLRIGSKRQ